MPTVNAPAPELAELARLIGNTPLLAIGFRYRGSARVVYAKCEHLNLTGSIKDRMALHILRRARETGRLTPGGRIAEATSGNTGISFAALGRLLGHPVTIFMPGWMSAERQQLIRGYGAEIVLVTHEQGGFLGAIRMSEELALRQPGVFLPRQFSNRANVDAHAATTAPEIFLQLQEAGVVLHAFVAGVGTGGTVMGVSRYFRQMSSAIRIHPVEPAESPTLSTGCQVGHHRIQGISDEFIPPIVDLASLDPAVAVPDGDSILMAQKLAAQLGLGVGISSGCNFLAAVRVQDEMGGRAAVATVFADDNKKYLTTGLFHAEPVRPSYISPELELTALRVLPRNCRACSEGLSAAL